MSLRSRHQLNNHRGFLLLEAAVSVVVLAVGLTLTLRSFNTSIMALKNIRDYQEAAFLLEEKLFQIESGAVKAEQSEGKFDAEDKERFSWKVEVSALEDAPLDKVKVTVFCNAAAAASPRNICAYTYIQRR